MRSKMLGLAIALSTFGLGVAATTVWIGLNTPKVSEFRQPLVRSYVTDQLSTRPDGDGGTPPALPTPFQLPKNATIVSGVLNSRAISKPAPVYPQAARAAHVSGPVVVQVTVDEDGNVISAKPVSGDPLLQQAATQAAYNWRFSPTSLSGHAVRVSGTITFNFVLD